MTFDNLGLNKPLLSALNDMGLTQPTTIQEKAFSVVMSGRDMIGIAQTGTGKTLAYLLPLLQNWRWSKQQNIEAQILILVPTRELVLQVAEQAEKLVKHMGLKVGGVFGGTNINHQVTMVREGLDILVATPGRLIDLVGKGEVRLKFVKKLVIDEVDEMLDMGFRFQLVRIFDNIPKRQNLMFSATLTEKVEELIETFFNAPIKIEAAPSGTPLSNIEQMAYYVPNYNTKVNLLKHWLGEKLPNTKGFILDSEAHTAQTEGIKVLVFVESKKIADKLFDDIEPEFPNQIGVVHSNKAQVKRFETVRLFKEGAYKVLIATDLIARGIDISEVTHVINIDTPEVAENYMHRIGRTGRADKKGQAITYITEGEKDFQLAIEVLMNYEIPILPLPSNLEISDVLADHELPVYKMKSPQIKLPKKDESNAAFHEKSAKRLKENRKIRRKEAMMLKYGKPQTKGAKVKKKK
ncbi:MAG: DEAD/DEAH box helicase [Saprospiraceae bacterium]|nr:DEAD/DEAH box helicase [Saprospiraceae bacterium]